MGNSNRKIKDNTILGLVYGSIALVCTLLIYILFTIFINGISTISWDYLTTGTNDQKIVANFDGSTNTFDYTVETDAHGTVVATLDNVSQKGTIKDNNGSNVSLQNGTVVEKINGDKLSDMSEADIDVAMEELKAPTSETNAMIVNKGGGIAPLIITTLFVVIWSLLFAIPFGLFAAIYLIEYEVNPKLNKYIHFAIDSLAGIPSIIFGLFGSLFFGMTLGLGQSLISGILTVSIMLLPIVIKTIEEALMAVPQTQREAALGLGATKSQTIFTVILPAALPGILIAVILSIGRVIGESAIFVFTVGTITAMPTLLGQGSTLTVYAYNITRENPDYSSAAAVSIIVIAIIIILNKSAKLLSKKMTKGAR